MSEIWPDEYYDRPINPEEYGVFGFRPMPPGRSELHVSIPYELIGNTQLIKKLDNSLNDQGMISRSEYKRIYWRSSDTKEGTAAKIIRDYLEGDGESLLETMWEDFEGWEE